LNAAAAESLPDFDLGPLSWVQAEIGQSLARGLDRLGAFRAAPTDASLLRQARNQIHQAVGAIELLGLEPAIAFTDEIERQLGRVEQMEPSEIEPTCAIVDRACRKLSIFLDELVAGAPPVSLKLFPEYEAMQRLRGVKAAAATDLFFPEMKLRTPLPGVPLPVSPKKLASHLVKQRRVYQHGLLGFLRGDEDGAIEMREAVAGLERVSVPESARAFWWTVGAFFEAIIAGGLDPGFGAKQLAARLDLQIRRVVEGSVKVATRLRREVLYYVAVSAPATPTVHAVQKAYGLAGARSVRGGAERGHDQAPADPPRSPRRARYGEEHLAARHAGPGGQSAEAQGDAAARARERDRHRQQCADRARGLARRVSRRDAAFRRCSRSVRDGVRDGNTARRKRGLELRQPCEQLSEAGRGDAAAPRCGPRIARDPAGTGTLVDGIFRRAQERVLLAQVAREIDVNLRRMEQVLDAFFRDSTKRSEIAALSHDSHQIRGAFQMLEQHEAEHLLRLCEDQIDSYANPDTPVGDGDLELLAESLCGLGFFVEAMQQQRADGRRLIAPLLAKRLGEAPSAEDRATETAEEAVEDLRGVLPKLVAEIRRAPADAAARAALTAKLKDLIDDATLIDDAELVAQATEALAELEALPEIETAGVDETTETVALEAAVTAIAESVAPVAAPAPALSAETQRLLATDANRLDAELLEIFLIEATEVLDAVVENRAQLARNPGDREALRSARRQFHTIKGSGRMVGLTELGELAYDVEKIHNRLLEEDRDVTPAMLELLEVAEANFRQWVGALQDTGDVYADPAALYAAIGRVTAELPAEFDAEAAVPVAAPVLEPELSVAADEAPVSETIAFSPSEPEVIALESSEPDVIEFEPSSVPETVAFSPSAPEPVALELSPEPDEGCRNPHGLSSPRWKPESSRSRRMARATPSSSARKRNRNR
jgi:chemosensory pili system protein ChpA (sensor histidine kinase/response regulator)